MKKRLIKVNSLEKQLGIPSGTIRLAMSGHRKLPKKHLAKIESHLKRSYNYAKEATTD